MLSITGVHTILRNFVRSFAGTEPMISISRPPQLCKNADMEIRRKKGLRTFARNRLLYLIDKAGALYFSAITLAQSLRIV